MSVVYILVLNSVIKGSSGPHIRCILFVYKNTDSGQKVQKYLSILGSPGPGGNSKITVMTATSVCVMYSGTISKISFCTYFLSAICPAMPVPLHSKILQDTSSDSEDKDYDKDLHCGSGISMHQLFQRLT